MGLQRGSSWIKWRRFGVALAVVGMVGLAAHTPVASAGTRLDASSADVSGSFMDAAQTSSGALGTYTPSDTDSRAIGIAAGTSPSIANSGGSLYYALEGLNNDLWIQTPDGTYDTGLGMMPGTSPSITALFAGGYEVAFQANTSDLWTTGTAGTKDWGAGMDTTSSPSITWNGGSGYEVALQTNTHDLWQLGTYSDYDYQLGMMPGTSPSITVTSTDGFEIAFQANTTDLWTVGDLGWKAWPTGMDPKSSPSITAAAGGYEVALQTNTNDLWTLGTDGYNDWQLGMMPGTSPSIQSVSGGGAGYEVAIQANDGIMWNAGALGTGGSYVSMAAGTNPAVAPYTPVAETEYPASVGSGGLTATTASTTSVNLAGAVSWALNHVNIAPQPPFEDDCADFVSQALSDGGGDREYVNPANGSEPPSRFPGASSSQNTTDNKYWYYFQHNGADFWSDSWSVAHDLFLHLKGNGSQAVSNWTQARPGDLIFANWHGSNSSGISHVGIITKMVNGMPYITQHTPDQTVSLNYWRTHGDHQYNGGAIIPSIHVWILVPNAH